MLELYAMFFFLMYSTLPTINNSVSKILAGKYKIILYILEVQNNKKELSILNCIIIILVYKPFTNNMFINIKI